MKSESGGDCPALIFHKGEDVMNEFFALFCGEIERFGGSITIYDTIDLQLYRKPDDGLDGVRIWR